SSAASKMISDLIPDLGKLESPGFDAVCRQLPTFPPSPVWVVAYSLSSFNYTSSQASNHHFFKSDELKINAFDFFILNVACILGIKNGDDSLIQKCEAHENIRKYIKHI